MGIHGGGRRTSIGRKKKNHIKVSCPRLCVFPSCLGSSAWLSCSNLLRQLLSVESVGLVSMGQQQPIEHLRVEEIQLSTAQSRRQPVAARAKRKWSVGLSRTTRQGCYLGVLALVAG